MHLHSPIQHVTRLQIVHTIHRMRGFLRQESECKNVDRESMMSVPVILAGRQPVDIHLSAVHQGSLSHVLMVDNLHLYIHMLACIKLAGNVKQ